MLRGPARPDLAIDLRIALRCCAVRLGNTSLAKGSTIYAHGELSSAAHVPAAKAIVISTYVPSDTCARTDEDVVPVTDPPAGK